MARVSLFQAQEGPHNFYNVHAAVGQGCVNFRPDVLLVQYFLRETFKGVPQFKVDPFRGGPLSVDGRAGPQTFAAILHFQIMASKSGAPTAQDGRVDPPVGEQLVGSISQTQYTIISLNAAYARARPKDWPRVSKAGDCPAELRVPLREPKFVAT